MTMITIRPMQFGDVEVCATIMATTPLWIMYGVTQTSALARLQEAIKSNADLFVAVDLNAPSLALGFIWTTKYGAFDRSGYIPLLAMNSAQRNHGIGRLLIEAAETFLGQTAADIFLLCSAINYDAQRFYARQGYTQIGHLSDYIKPGITELIYRKQLQMPV